MIGDKARPVDLCVPVSTTDEGRKNGEAEEGSPPIPYRPVFRPEDLIPLSYDGDEVPDTPPHPNFRWGEGLTFEQRKLMLHAVIPPPRVPRRSTGVIAPEATDDRRTI